MGEFDDVAVYQAVADAGHEPPNDRSVRGAHRRAIGRPVVVDRPPALFVGLDDRVMFRDELEQCLGFRCHGCNDDIASRVTTDDGVFARHQVARHAARVGAAADQTAAADGFNGHLTGSGTSGHGQKVIVNSPPVTVRLGETRVKEPETLVALMVRTVTLPL